jgi:hypothetical protein
MRAFVIIIIVLIILLYLQYYIKYKNDYNILQIYLNNFEINTLYEKYPIVIYDQVYDINELLTTAFKFSYAFKNIFTINSISFTFL